MQAKTVNWAGAMRERLGNKNSLSRRTKIGRMRQGVAAEKDEGDFGPEIKRSLNCAKGYEVGEVRESGKWGNYERNDSARENGGI